MDIHIDKKLAGLLIVALVIGGIVGGTIGFVAGSHEEGDRYEMHDGNRKDRMGQRYDDQLDGETNDDNGGAPNSDEQIKNAPLTTPVTSDTTVQIQPKQ